MEEYRHLLAAVDLSTESGQVVQRAVALRDKCGAKLSLVHVVEYVPMAYAGDLALPDDYSLEQELLGAARRRMSELGKRIGVPEADRHLLLGNTAKEIVRIVQERGMDLIVLGSHGRHGLSMLLGSTANAVLHHARCDVLAVRISERPESG
jgi:universal stress protein A